MEASSEIVVKKMDTALNALCKLVGFKPLNAAFYIE